jgi:hypothetical protein
MAWLQRATGWLLRNRLDVGDGAAESAAGEIGAAA